MVSNMIFNTQNCYVRMFSIMLINLFVIGKEKEKEENCDQFENTNNNCYCNDSDNKC